MKSKKAICCLIILAMATMLFISCNQTTTPEPTTPAPETSTTTPEATTPEASGGGSKVTGKTIGFVIPGPDVYYNFAKGGVQWAVEASGNIYAERNSENNTVKEIQNVENLISAQVDAILTQTTNADTGQKAAEICNEAGIPFFLVDCEITDGPGEAQGAVTTPLPPIGGLMAEYLVDQGIGGDYVILAGLPGQPGGEIQLQAFQEIFAAEPGNNLLSEVQYADWDRKKGEDLMRNYLIMHDKIDLVYAMNEEMAYGAYTAIEDAQRQDEMVIVSANGSAVGKEMIEQGKLLATTGWSPSENGILAVLKILEYLNGTPEDFQTFTPISVYTKDNLDVYPDWEVTGMAARYEPIYKEKGYWN